MRIPSIIFLILILACASHPVPEWMEGQPNAKGYWFGIGIVEKPFDGGDCREEALNKALSEISSQISVEVSGSFKRVVTENNLSLDEFSESVLKTRVDKTLPNVEYIDFYDSKEHCGLLARLSQSIYYETIERQRRNAIQSALGLLAQADSDFNFQTFTYLNEAIREIMPYMDIPIEEEYPSKSGKIVNLYRYIKVATNQYMNRLTLLPDQDNLKVKLGFTRDLQLGVRVIDNTDNSPIENIPIICYLNNREKNMSALSNKDGDCIFSIPPITDKHSIQYINYEVSKPEILENIELFGALSKIQAQSTMQVNPPKINIHIIENNLGKATMNPYIQPVFTDFFSQQYSANFIDTDNADLIISGTVNTRAVSETPNDYGIYLVFGDMTISISHGDSGEELLSKSFNQVQGSDFHSNKEAANQAIKKMSKKVTDNFLPKIIELIEGL